jgi:hypothetical protein
VFNGSTAVLLETPASVLLPLKISFTFQSTQQDNTKRPLATYAKLAKGAGVPDAETYLRVFMWKGALQVESMLWGSSPSDTLNSPIGTKYTDGVRYFVEVEVDAKGEAEFKINTVVVDATTGAASAADLGTAASAAGPAATQVSKWQSGASGEVSRFGLYIGHRNHVPVKNVDPNPNPLEGLNDKGFIGSFRDVRFAGHGARFSAEFFTLEDANGSHACSLEANMRVTNGIPLGSPLPLPLSS